VAESPVAPVLEVKEEAEEEKNDNEEVKEEN